MARLNRCMIFLSAAALFFIPGLSAAPQDVNPAQVQEEAMLAQKIAGILQRYHYSHPSLDKEFSKRLFHQTLKFLDVDKKYFLKGDVDRLKHWEIELDAAIRENDLGFVYELKDLYMKRVTERLDEVRKLLSRPMDFTLDETFETDGDKKDYCSTVEEIHERWRKLLKYQVLTRKVAKDLANRKSKVKKTEAQILKEIREKMLKSYRRVRRYALKRRGPKLVESYYDLIASVFDPHSNHFSASEYENFNISMKLSFEGIGAALVSQDGLTKVVRIIPGGAADRGGKLQPEDIILQVAQGDAEPVDVVDMELDEVVQLIRGKKGTEVRLTVRPGTATDESETRVISIIRDKVKLEDQSAKAAVYEYGQGEEKKKFGYIKVPSFYRDFQAREAPTVNADGTVSGGRSSAADVRRLIGEIKEDDVAGIIIDLRNNGGGSLPDAIQMAGLFIPQGPVVQVRNLQGRIKAEQDPDPELFYGGPLLVMVNHSSASASEIFSAAMQDYHRAVIVGNKKTHGKGTVQTIIDLNRAPPRWRGKYVKPGALKLTISKFYRVSGHSTQRKGVSPDVLLPGLYDGIKTGEESLDFALPWDTIPPAAFVPFSDGIPDLDRLRKRSADRISKSRYFQNLLQRQQLITRDRNETIVTLNEEKMIAKRNQSRKLVKEFGHIRREWQLKQHLISRELYDKWESRARNDVDLDQEQLEHEQIQFRDKIRKLPEKEREAWERNSWRDQEVEEALNILNDFVS